MRVSRRAQRGLWGLRLARLYGIGVGISYALLAFGLASDPKLATSLWTRCLTTASWVAGLGALSLARDLVARDEAQGITSLARLRGFGDQALERARTLSGAVTLFGAVAAPGLLVALAALLRFRTVPGALSALSLALMTLPYAALLGGVLTVLARLCSRLLPERGRWLLLALVLGPWLLARGTGSALPSIPGAFAWLLDHLAGTLP
ncbi:MAG TPA: hypothetical protein VJN18_25860 [Polyangiaceae bacterium]|nr:hypothetical protein [Polyangiaceae bacterium]